MTGGEPFLKEDFEQIYRKLNKMGLMVSINTNASLYDGEIRKLLKCYPPTRLNVSFTPDNVKDMGAIHQISNELNLQAKATSYMYPPVRVNGEIGNNIARFNAEEAGKVLEQWSHLRDSEELFACKIEKIKKCQSADLCDACVDVEQEGVMCRAGRSSFWMTWDGLRKMVADIRLPIE